MERDESIRASASLLLQSNSWEERCAGAAALGVLGNVEDKMKLTALLTDKDPLVRAEAVRSLQRIGAHEALAEIRQLFAAETEDHYMTEYLSGVCAEAITQLESCQQGQLPKAGNW
jgi:hypothetical protein